MLIICGCSLLIDSIINFVIQFLNEHLKSQCVLGIITTASFFYIGWGTIALRAYRVKAVFDTYDGYLKALADKDSNKKDTKSENLLSLVTYNFDEYDMTSPLPKRLSIRNTKTSPKKGEQLDRLS